MTRTAPTQPTPSPETPDRAVRTGFALRAANWADWLKNHAVDELYALAVNAYNNAVDAYNSALAAATQVDAATAQANAAAASAASAAAAAGVALWVSGTTYAAGACVYSPTDFQTYRRKAGGAGTTDPSADATNWTLLGTYVSNVSIERAIRRARQSTFA